MKSILSLLFILSFVLTSCKKENVTEANNSTSGVVPFTEVGKQMRTETPVSQQPQQITTSTVQAAPVASVAAPATVAKGMNPPHGQPGHRCDISVGAPLNSPVAAAKAAPTAQTTTNAQAVPASAAPANSTSPAVATTPTPEGMNPPHGQTNHRCDIAVGAPLPKT